MSITHLLPNRAEAEARDRRDPLAPYRDQFYFPKHEGEDVLYLCGNSLGLQPQGVQAAIQHELEMWRTHAVEGHFRTKLAWMYYHKFLQPQSANLVGALPSEVVVMNTLTVNLHLLLVSFYRPTSDRYKIVMEAGAFPSDQYAVESQVRFHGFDPSVAIVEVAPRPGEETLRTEDIVEVIENHGDTVATVMFGGVNYYTGQFFDLATITEAGHRVGATVGFDLAHAAGNVPLQLHDWNVDYACWCSYKYLNSGPGGPSGIFVHERHAERPELPRFAGWWGHDEKERFQMKKGFVPMSGAAGWQLSNVPIFGCAAHRVSLDLFVAADIQLLREKSLELTGYLEQLIHRLGTNYEIITPTDPAQRGCQLSIVAGSQGTELFQFLTQRGVMCDWREPNVIRVAPVPFYNRFTDVYDFVQLLAQANEGQT